MGKQLLSLLLGGFPEEFVSSSWPDKRACPAPGQVAHYTTWWEQGCTLPAQAAPRAAGSLLTAEQSLQQCWELLLPPSYFPASSSLFQNDWLHAKLLLPGAQAALLISSYYPRNLLSG